MFGGARVPQQKKSFYGIAFVKKIFRAFKKIVTIT
jgi:hypothetical protein